MPDRANVAYCYDGSFEGLLCCIFESFEKKERPVSIHHRAANADRVISGVCVCEIALPGKEFYFYHLHGG